MFQTLSKKLIVPAAVEIREEYLKGRAIDIINNGADAKSGATIILTYINKWDNTFGGTGHDWAYSVQQTTNGGFIIAGWTTSFGTGEDDLWLVKTDVDGYLR